MTYYDETHLYKVDSNSNLIVRKQDNVIMGDSIDLGESDSIDNYEEREFTSEEIQNFWKSIDNGKYIQSQEAL